MNKFGYIRGRRGPPGPPGKNALDFQSWLPEGVVKMFREGEDCTYYFDTATDGIIEEVGGKHALKDRYGKNHAVCIQNYQKPVKLGKSGIYGLPLKIDTKFKVPGILNQGLVPPSILVVAFSFKLLSRLDEKPYYIFTNKSGSRGVSINNKRLDIWGTTGSPQLEYEKKGYNTMLLQYSRITDAGKDRCFFVLNGQVGSFDPKVIEEVESDFYIGGGPKQQTAPVMLTSFEVYSKGYFDEAVDNYLLPKEIYTSLTAYLENRDVSDPSFGGEEEEDEVDCDCE